LKNSVRNYLFFWKVNKVVSTFMTFYNDNKDKKVSPANAKEIVQLLQNFAPGFNL